MLVIGIIYIYIGSQLKRFKRTDEDIIDSNNYNYDSLIEEQDNKAEDWVILYLKWLKLTWLKKVESDFLIF